MIRKILFITFVSTVFAINSIQNDVMYDFLNLGVNAKVQALGNTGIVTGTGAEATMYNPANLFNVPHKNLVFSMNPLYFDVNHLYAFYSMNSKQDPFTKIGIGFIKLSIDGIEERQNIGQTSPIGTISASDYALILATSKLITYSTSIGFNVGLIGSDYRENSNDFFMTFGVNHLANDIKMRLASTFQLYNNAGYKYSIGATSYGFNSFQPTVVLDIYSHNRYMATYISLGLEYTVTDSFSLLAGYDKEHLTMGLSTGLFDSVDFNYAAVFAALGTRHQFSFNLGI